MTASTSGARQDRSRRRRGDPAVGFPELSALLGRLSGEGGGLYRHLALRLRELIERGDLAPGTLLPPARELARGLSLSRGTVMNALDVLRDQRLLEIRQGSGARVRLDAPRPPLADTDLLDPAASARSLSGRLVDLDSGVVDLAVAIVHDAEALRDIPLPTTWDELESAGERHGYAPRGLPSLRQALCRYYLDRGLRTAPDEVLVTSGAQQGLDLCAALALRPGDCVLVESPTYPGALDAFSRYGARIVTVPFSSHWDAPMQLRDAVVEHAPRLVYLMPGMHNPTGRILPDSRRREVARLADRHALYVIEDDTLADVAFEPRDSPLVAAYSSGERVLSIGSVSKSAWGGLRTGWIRGNAGLISRLARSKAAKDLGLSPLPQLVTERVLENLEFVLDARRTQLATGSAVLRGQLAAVLPEWTFTPPSGGLSLWVRLPAGDADEFVQIALRRKVAVISGSAHCVDGSGSDHLRVAFSQPVDVLEEGVRRLRGAWDEYATRLGKRPARPPVKKPPSTGHEVSFERSRTFPQRS